LSVEVNSYIVEEQPHALEKGEAERAEAKKALRLRRSPAAVPWTFPDAK
jgi:hypothetical protein